MILKEETKQLIVELQKKYPNKRSALIPALHLAQSDVGYLPKIVQEEVAALFDILPNEVYSIVTFYDMLHEEPVGKHLIHVCKNVSCMLRGADGVIAKMCEKLNVAPHEMSKDGQFTIIPSECLGACDLAPVAIIDDLVVGCIKEEDVDRILEDALKGNGHACPVCVRESSDG